MASSMQEADNFIVKADAEVSESERLCAQARDLVTPALMERARKALAGAK